VNSLTPWIPLVSSHSVFRDDFLVYSDSVFAEDLQISSDIAFLTILCISHNSILAIDLMCWSLIHLRCRFHMSGGTQFSKMISISTVNKFSLTIYGSAVTLHFSQFHAVAMTLFLLSIQYVSWHLVFSDDFKFYSESVFANDLWISSDIAFLIIPCVNNDSIFAIEFMRRSWIHWRYWFHTLDDIQYPLTILRSTVTLFSLMIYGSTVT